VKSEIVKDGSRRDKSPLRQPDEPKSNKKDDLERLDELTAHMDHPGRKAADDVSLVWKVMQKLKKKLKVLRQKEETDASLTLQTESNSNF